ncbi:DUF4861 family protein [Chryseolinea lacunae]|uniref:DUF4861 domain-containing protein n=1 Tax=Chryseolinea lacunae TaxID=2801331 RepID=A0ABS1KTR2_9BACT|nr:DUF4861 family protein [Chryseolinea lacunae]MBL0742844.1 DUF4861 domain-containing protein [Chryseolinea lacunae]
MDSVKNSVMIVVSMAMLVSCRHPQKTTVVVTNPLDLARTEIVSFDVHALDSARHAGTHLIVRDAAGNTLVSQPVDVNDDGKADELLFQVTLKPKEEQKYSIEESGSPADTVQATLRTYARFVPERIDDFAWENDRVAFRTYGPEAQRLVDEKQPGGTLSSGIDCWLKRVDYPIINKWYKKGETGGTYHHDDGEGLDNYHVGASRGCGGIGVWKNDSLYVSKNYVTHKTTTNGPLRTVFELTYAPWKVDDITVNETKRITIDLGNQMSKIEEILRPSAPLPNCTIGVTLHDKKGDVKTDSLHGWTSYWEPLDDSYLGTAVLIDPAHVQRFQDFRTTKKDLSHLYVVAKASEGNVTFYTAFGWKKAGRFDSFEAWTTHLNEVAARLAAPVQIKTLK